MAVDPYAQGAIVTLSCKDLSVTRGRNLVLESVSAQIEPGQVTAIVGPNGAGKSSLLMTLAGLLTPVTGEVALDGAVLGSIAPRERAKQIGYLPQNAQIAWDVAVENVVALGRMPHQDRQRDPVEAAIRTMQLEELRHRPASKLSGGERARVLLARVLAGEPNWILADEPLAALDLSHQVNLIAHLASLANAGDGAGVVIVLHDLATAMNHADRVLLLREGRLVADGPPDQVLCEANIANGWGVSAQWLGEPGQHALVTTSAD